MTVRIRAAGASDAEVILAFVRDLARYERLENEVQASADDFRKALAAPSGISALIAETEDGPAGFALYFFNFSTFAGKRGIYLEDLFVREDKRGQGAGRALLAELARIALANDCARLEWSVLDWNAPAIAFYESLGAAPKNEWMIYRLAGGNLRSLAGFR